MVSEVSSSTTTVPPLSRDFHGCRRAELRPRGGEPRQRRHRAHLGAQIGFLHTGHPGRHLLAVRQTLITAEPANLGHQFLHIGNPLCGNLIQAYPGRLGPVGDHQSLLVGQRLPEGLGDERDHRVQQPQQRVQRRRQHGRGVRDPLGELRLGQFDVPVAEFVPCEVVERLAAAAELVVVERRIDFRANLFQPPEDPSVGVGELGRRGHGRQLSAVEERVTGGVEQLGAEIARRPDVVSPIARSPPGLAPRASVNRRASAPKISTQSSGSMTLPLDLLILRPDSSRISPCKKTSVNGTCGPR